MFSKDANYHKYNGVEVPKRRDLVCSSGAAALFSRALARNCFPIPESLPNEDNWISLYYQYMAIRKIACPCICTNYRIHNDNSIKKDAPYEQFREQYFRREKVCPLFAERYKTELKDEYIFHINRRFKLAKYIYQEKTLKIVAMSGITLKDKIRAILLSNRHLYRLKVRFNTLLYGH